MGNEILEQAKKLLNNEESVKILVTFGEEGAPHPVVKSSLRSEGDSIVYTEFIESSLTNRSMTRSLWFDKTVAILVLGPDGTSYRITALPVRAIVSGKTFQRYYEEARKKYGDFDLATVWVLKPLEIHEQTLRTKAAEESKNRPYFLHLDRLARENKEAV
jgi:hypothetical protein